MEGNNIEARNISVTLKQAMEWYNSGNATLRALALDAYREEELEFSYIESKINQTCGCFNTPLHEQKKFQVLAKLAIIAKYYNWNWRKTIYNRGYFLGEYTNVSSSIVARYKDVGVYQHDTIRGAGVVYFKNREDAIKAIKILGDEVKELFK